MDIDNLLKKYIPLLVAFSTICACLWHISYWSKFDIDIFSYLDISDIIKSFLYPFLVSCGVGLIGSVISALTTDERVHRFLQGKATDEAEERHKLKVQKVLMYIWVVLVILSIVFGHLDGGLVKQVLLPLLLFFGALAGLFKSGIFDNAIPNRNVRVFCITLLTVIPFLSYLYAKQEANYVYKNWRYKMWVNKSAEYKQDTIKYLGKGGDFYFFTTKDNKRTIIN